MGCDGIKKGNSHRIKGRERKEKLKQDISKFNTEYTQCH